MFSIWNEKSKDKNRTHNSPTFLLARPAAENTWIDENRIDEYGFISNFIVFTNLFARFPESMHLNFCSYVIGRHGRHETTRSVWIPRYEYRICSSQRIIDFLDFSSILCYYAPDIAPEFRAFLNCPPDQTGCLTQRCGRKSKVLALAYKFVCAQRKIGSKKSRCACRVYTPIGFICAVWTLLSRLLV